MKLIIAGSRNFDNYELAEKIINFYIEKNKVNTKELEIISGGAKGADKLGERYAEEHNIKLTRCKANWSKYGKQAGMVRNSKMAKESDALIAFWDGMSRGTKNMIETALRRKLDVYVYETNGINPKGLIHESNNKE